MEETTMLKCPALPTRPPPLRGEAAILHAERTGATLRVGDVTGFRPERVHRMLALAAVSLSAEEHASFLNSVVVEAR